MSSGDKSKQNQKRCYYCNQIIKGTEFKFSCDHIYCLHCLSLSLIHSKFTQMSNDKISFYCVCEHDQGELDLTMEEYISKINEFKICSVHEIKGKKYCLNCKRWICDKCLRTSHSKDKNHKLVEREPKEIKCPIHGEDCTMLCDACDKEYCNDCLKQSEESHELRKINEYMEEKSDELKKRFNIITKNDLTQIIGNKKTAYVTAIHKEFIESQKNIENLISTLQKISSQIKENYEADIKYADDSLKLLNFSYDNLFEDLSSPKDVSYGVYKNLENLNNEIKEINYNYDKLPIFEKFLFQLQKYKEKKVHKINFEFKQLSGAGDDNILTFPSKHTEFLSSFSKLCDDSLNQDGKYTEENKIFFSGSLDNHIHIYQFDALTKSFNLKKVMGEENGHSGSIQCMSPLDNNYLITGSSDCSIKIWNLTTFECEETLQRHSKPIKCLLYVPLILPSTNDKLITCDEDGKINVWNYSNHDLEKTLNEDTMIGINCIGETYNYNIIYTCDKEGKLTVYDKEMNEIKCFGKEDGFDEEITVNLTLKDFRIALGRKDGIISIRSPEKKFNEDLRLEGHTDWVTALALAKTDKGYQLISGSRDETIRIWSLEHKTCLNTLKLFENTVCGLSVSENRYVLAAGAEGVIKVFKL
ncbi:MAG: hypothetical protein MJ252_09320 [archaeon]|nr:hypothetical protein [archaeon]